MSNSRIPGALRGYTDWVAPEGLFFVHGAEEPYGAAMRVSVSGKQFKFPRTCACCGSYPLTSLSVSGAEKNQRARTKGWAWEVPYCTVCQGRSWVETSDIWSYLGPDLMPCVSCGGEGSEESGGPVTWTCTSCLGTGLMPTALLAQFDLTKESFYHQDWRDADVSNQNLRGATF